MIFDGFDWDTGNWPKCGKHGLTRSEIEEALSGGCSVYPDVKHSEAEERFLAIGQASTGRWIFAAFCWRGDDENRLLRPISARPMHDREVQHYVESQ